MPTSRRSSEKAYSSLGTGFVPISGGASNGNRQDAATVSRITANMTFDIGTEEHIVSVTQDIKLQSLQSHWRYRPTQSWCRKKGVSQLRN
jgi:hypothetical protein